MKPETAKVAGFFVSAWLD